MTTKAHDIIKKIESHCDAVIVNRRLRFHIVQELQRAVDEAEAIKSNIANVLAGHKTHDPRTQKAIKRSARNI